MAQVVKNKLDKAFRRSPYDEGVVTLSTRRVYLLPTGRGIGVGIAAIVMLLIGMNYGVSLAYLSSFFVLGYLVCALIAGYRNLVDLDVAFTSTDDAFVGGAAVFKFTLASRRDRHFIVLASRDAAALAKRVTPGMASVELRVPANARGTLNLGRVRIQTVAPTGLIRAFSYVHFAAEAIVYPALLHPAPAWPTQSATLPLSNNDRTEAKHASPQHAHSGDTLDGLREYVAGDSLARVAWGAVASGLSWRSKQMTDDQPRPLAFGWAQTAVNNDTETRLSTLATWVTEAQRRGLSYSLSLPESNFPPAQSREHMRDCLRAIALTLPQAITSPTTK